MPNVTWKLQDGFSAMPKDSEQYVVLANYNDWVLKIENPTIDVTKMKLTDKQTENINIFVRALLVFLELELNKKC